MIYVLAAIACLAVLFLGAALIYVLTESSQERARASLTLSELVARVQHPELPLRPLERLPDPEPLTPEEMEAIRAFNQIGTVVHGD